jgi:tripartite ATP-independent transporter DctM subunit
MIALLFGSFTLLLVIGFPVALVMGGASLVTILASEALRPVLLPQHLFNGINSFPLMAVPLFILAADLMTAGRLTDALLRFAKALVGHLPGGLGHVNILVSILFAGKSGSALADAAGPGAIVLDMMRRAGYPPYYAGAMTASSAIIGPIIPPSIVMVVYAVSDSRVTVSGMFAAGILPGILLGVALFITNHVVSVRKGYQFAAEFAGWRAVATAFLGSIPGLLMPVIILGGVFSGVFTATEAAAVAVFYALVVGLVVTRALRWHQIPAVFLKSALMTSGVLLIVSMASIFANLLTVLQVPQTLAAWLTSLTQDTTQILILLTLFVLVCGLFIDTLPAVIVLTPILAPIAFLAGIDPLHFATLFIVALVLGMITPPVGPVLFVVATVGRLRVERLARAVVPMLLAQLVVLALMVVFPAISLYVPRLLGHTR